MQLAIIGLAAVVRTSLLQAPLSEDFGILGTAGEYNQVNVGVYGSVLRGSRVRRGDVISLQ